MKKIRLVIADTDAAYIESISAYLRSSPDSSRFDVKFFSKSQSLNQYISDRHPVDILVVSPDIRPQVHSYQGLLLLLEDDQIIKDSPGDPGVFKYQALNQFISEILSLYYDFHGKIQTYTSGSQKAKTIAVYSASGGAGKTSLAVSLAGQLAMLEKRVFYLNLETVHSTSLFFTSPEDQPSSQILYYTKTKQEQLVSKVESLKKYHSESKVEYFDLAVNAQEMLSISESEINVLITALIETNRYDYIIIDLDSSIHDRVKASLKMSDYILWVLNNDLGSFHKTQYLLKNGDDIFGGDTGIEDKSIVVLNQYQGSLLHELKAFELDIKGYIPYVPDWKGLKDGSDILKTPVFQKEILRLLDIYDDVEQGGWVYG